LQFSLEEIERRLSEIASNNPITASRSRARAPQWKAATTGASPAPVPARSAGRPVSDRGEPPFTLSSDPKFVYHSAAYDTVAQEMLTAIGRRDGLVVLTGETGVGKTTLCRALVDQLDRRTLTSLVVLPCTSAEDLLRTILVDFGVITRANGAAALLTRGDLESAFHDFLVSLAQVQAFAVVVLDEAQDLPVDVFDRLRAWIDLVDGVRLLQVVLVGQPSLLKMLERRALRQLSSYETVRCVLGGLEREEVGEYALHRLSVSGQGRDVGFDDAAAARVFELVGGVPAAVNFLCQRALAEVRRSSTATIDESVVETVARDLRLAPPSAKSGWPPTLATLTILVLFVLAGAAAAAFVFRDQVAILMGQ
jgi:type II secretory pathway predicted ATPase ExeA